MLNMLLAIIMDTYMQVKGRVGHCETLWSQAKEIYRRYRQLKRGERVSLSHIVKHLRKIVKHLPPSPSRGGVQSIHSFNTEYSVHSVLSTDTSSELQSTNAVITKDTMFFLIVFLCFSNCLLIFGNFERLVLGCIEAKFCKQILNTKYSRESS